MTSTQLYVPAKKSEILEKETDLNQLIQKFEAHDGNHIGQSVRGVRLRDEWANPMVHGEFAPEGSVFTDKTFTSTSREAKTADRYASQHGDVPTAALVHYIGRTAADWTMYGFDKEAIFGSKKPFSVLLSGLDPKNKVFRRVFEEKGAFPENKGKSPQGIAHLVDVGTLSPAQKSPLQKIQTTTKSTSTGALASAHRVPIHEQLRINLAFALQHFHPAQLYQFYKQHLRASDKGSHLFKSIASRIPGTDESSKKEELRTLKVNESVQSIMEMLGRHLPPKALVTLNTDLGKLVNIHKANLLARRHQFGMPE